MPARITKYLLVIYVLCLSAGQLWWGASLWLAAAYSLLPCFMLPTLLRVSLPVFAAVCAVPLVQAVIVAGDWQHYLLPFNVLLLVLLMVAHQILQHRRDKQLERSKAQLDALWATVVDGLIVINDQGRIASANPATEAIFGYSEHELLDRNVKILMPERYAVEHDGYIDAYNKTREARIIGIGREVAGRRKDGSEFPLYLAVNRFEVAGDVYYGGIVRDMSEETKIKDDLVAAKNAAEDANRSKTIFLSSISHEVRTPLNAILGFAQLFEMVPGNELTPKQSEYLGHIRRSGEHLLALINEVLDLSQIESGNLRLSIESISAKSVLEECIAMVQPLAEKNAIELTMPDVIDEQLAVKADRVRLRQALMNLLTNAVKYNRRGGSVLCAIEPSPKGGGLRFVVTDTGEGVPKERWSQLFEPFNRLGREASTIEGTGIGLAVTKTVIEAMKGEIGLSSEVGKGTQFWIDLPLSKRLSQRGEASEVEYEFKIKRQLTPIKKDVATILYIEDNPANTLLMEQFLGDIAGLNLITVLTAEEGLEVVADQHIDLILMDLNLPGMDGFEAQTKLATSDRTRNIPVIAVSADVNAKTIQRAMNVGFRQFITKPFDLKEAHRAIVSVLPRGGENGLH